MTADIDAVLSRLRERPECRDAVEVIEELRRRKATDDGAYEHVVGLYHAADEALRVAERDLAALTAERDRLREAIRWHRLAAEETVGVPTDDHKYYEPFDHALWAALGESPVPTGPADSHIRQGMRSLADEWRRREADRRAQVWNTAENAAAADAYDACADEVEDLLAAPSHPTGEPGGAT